MASLILSFNNQTPTESSLEENTHASDTLHPAVFFLLWLNVVLTSGGNLLTIIVFLSDKNIYSKPGNILIMNLALADLNVGLLSLPWLNLWMHYGDWIFGEYVCKWWIVIDYGVTIESTLTMMIISWDRHFMVNDIQNYMRSQTRNRVILIIVASWVLSFGFCFFTVLLVEPITGERNIDYTVDCDFPANYYISLTIFEINVLFIIPVFALAYFNIKLFYIIRKRAQSVQPGDVQIPTLSTNMGRNQNQLPMPARNEADISVNVSRQSLHKDRKAAITLTLLVVTFLLCYTPYNIVIILELVSANSEIIKNPLKREWGAQSESGRDMAKFMVFRFGILMIFFWERVEDE
ncbi:histamine H4 receptor-like [Amphiura filiformis]|uniref:histamine H4 receptor-like n=1 Tax=Amphiura filiformis TaxID=82378 RepID=UPI003B22027D